MTFLCYTKQKNTYVLIFVDNVSIIRLFRKTRTARDVQVTSFTFLIRMHNMIDTQEFDPLRYWRIILKHRYWVVLVALLTSTTLILGNKVFLPEEYEAAALIRVSLPTLDRENQTPQDPVRVVREELLSRAVLEQVVNKLHLQDINADEIESNIFVDLLTAIGKTVEPRKVTTEQIIRTLRKSITVLTNDENTRLANQTEIFSVSLKGKDPELVSSVINACIEAFIEKKRTSRLTGGQEMVQFLQTQVKKAEDKIITRSRMIDTFKQQNALLLAPEDRIADAYFQAKRHLFDAESALQEAISQKRGDARALQTESRYTPEVTPAGEVGSLHPADKLVFLNNSLADARARYSEEHPDVIRLKREIQEADKVIQNTNLSDISRQYNPRYRDLMNSIAQATDRIEEAQTRVAYFKSEVERLQYQLEQIPRVREMLNSMEEVKARLVEEHQMLNEKLVDAQIVSQATELSVGNTYEIIDPAVRPVLPTITSRIPILIISAIVGMLAGIGVPILLELFKVSEAVLAPRQTTLFYSGAVTWTLVLVAYISVVMFEQTWTIY